MTYPIGSKEILIELERTSIVDISIGDQLEASIINSAYSWTEQDMQFLESNPDARIFLRFEKTSKNAFSGKGLVVMPQEVF